jgi:competence protein ComEA
VALDLDHVDQRRDEPTRPPPPRTWRERVDALADATGVTPTRLVAGALAVAVAAAVGWWLLRPPPAPSELSIPYASTTVAPGAGPQSTVEGAAGATSTTVPTEVVVHVAGAVVRPGVHTLPVGARVVDAVDAAGGLSAAADQTRVNLAALVSDGERVYVPTVGEQPPPPVASGAGEPRDNAGEAGGVEGAPIDINTATEADLEELPGVGPATAAAIIEHRQSIGGFTSIDQLLDVRGIGEAKLEQLRPLVRV